MIDDQVLGTAAVALLLFAYEAAVRQYRHRQDHGRPHHGDEPPPTDVELTSWMSVVDRVVRPRN